MNTSRSNKIIETTKINIERMLKKLKPNSNFSRNVLTMMTGTGIAQAIPIAISPILSRIYTPEDFGVLAIYMSITFLLSVLATARYELAVPLPRIIINKLAIIKLSFFIAILITIISISTILITSFINNELISSSKIGIWIYYVPLSVLFIGFYVTLNYWHTGAGNYKQISFSRFFQAVGTGFAGITLGEYINGPAGLVIGALFGQLIALIILTSYLPKGFIDKFLAINKRRIYWVAKKYKQFPLFNAPHAMFAVGKENLIILFISINYASVALGFYYMTMRLMMLPANLLGSAVAQVFYAEVSKEYKLKNNIRKKVMLLMVSLFLIGLIPATVITLFSEIIFSVAFGVNWIESGVYAAYIVPYVLFHFIASPIGMVPLVVGRQKNALYWGITESSLFVAVFVLSNYLYNDLGKSLILLSTIMPIYFIVYFTWIVYISKNEDTS